MDVKRELLTLISEIRGFKKELTANSQVTAKDKTTQTENPTAAVSVQTQDMSKNTSESLLEDLFVRN